MFLSSLALDTTSAHPIRKVAIAANKAREHTMRRSSNIDEEGIASAIRGLREMDWIARDKASNLKTTKLGNYCN